MGQFEAGDSAFPSRTTWGLSQFTCGRFSGSWQTVAACRSRYGRAYPSGIGAGSKVPLDAVGDFPRAGGEAGQHGGGQVAPPAIVRVDLVSSHPMFSPGQGSATPATMTIARGFVGSSAQAIATMPPKLVAEHLMGPVRAEAAPLRRRASLACSAEASSARGGE